MGRKVSSRPWLRKAVSFFNRLFHTPRPKSLEPGAKKEELNNFQKAAVFFLTLPPEATSRLISSLSSHEIRYITSEMKQLDYVTPNAQKEVMQEFCGLLVSDGKLPLGMTPTREAVTDLADRDPKGIMGLLRRHWLLPVLPRPAVRPALHRLGPGERAAIFLHHLPPSVLRRLLPQLAPEEIHLLGQGMIRLSSLPEEAKHQTWNELSRWLRGNLEDQESVLKLLHHLLREDGLPEQEVPLSYPEKVATLLRLLKPEASAQVGQKLLGYLDRALQESLILALRHVAEAGDREKGEILREVFSFIKCSLVSHGSLDASHLLEEVERAGLHMPLQVARCLEAHWLHPKNLLGEWRELAESHAEFAAQKLALFMRQEGLERPLFSSFQKAALFLRLIHPEIREEILKQLGAPQREFLVTEIERPWRITQNEKRKVLEEFLGQYYFLTTAKLLEKTQS